MKKQVLKIDIRIDDTNYYIEYYKDNGELEINIQNGDINFMIEELNIWNFNKTDILKHIKEVIEFNYEENYKEIIKTIEITKYNKEFKKG